MEVLEEKLRINWHTRRHIELWLGSEEEDYTQIYCIICRGRLVGVHQRIIAIMPVGMMDVEFLSPPIQHLCKKCNTTYHIKNVI